MLLSHCLKWALKVALKWKWNELTSFLFCKDHGDLSMPRLQKKEINKPHYLIMDAKDL